MLLNDIEIYDLAARFADRLPTSSIPPVDRAFRSGDDPATAWLVTLAHANRTESLPNLARELVYGAPGDTELQEVLAMLESRTAVISRRRIEAWLMMFSVGAVTTVATGVLLWVLLFA